MPQFLAEPRAGMAAKRFVTLTVFGVLVTFLNITTFAESMAHAPVNVQTLNTLLLCGTTARERSPAAPGRAFSTARTTLAILATAGRVNEMRSGMVEPGSESA
jgi:hypothetical protein